MAADGSGAALILYTFCDGTVNFHFGVFLTALLGLALRPLLLLPHLLDVMAYGPGACRRAGRRDHPVRFPAAERPVIQRQLRQPPDPAPTRSSSSRRTARGPGQRDPGARLRTALNCQRIIGAAADASAATGTR